MNRTFRAAGLAIAAAAILVLPPGAASASTFVTSPTSITYPAQTVGTSGVPGAVTVLVTCTVPGNAGTCMLQGMFAANPTFSGANSGDFTQTNNCASPGNTLNSGPFASNTATCTFNVTFKPTDAGLRAATLMLGTDFGGGAQPPPISLSGTAVAAPPTGQRAAALAKCKKKHGKKRKKCKNKANQLPV